MHDHKRFLKILPLIVVATILVIGNIKFSKNYQQDSEYINGIINRRTEIGKRNLINKKIKISVADEMHITNKTFSDPEFLRSTVSDVPFSKPTEKYLNTLVKDILSVSDSSNVYDFNIFPTKDSVFAISFPGGRIGLSYALLRYSLTEAEMVGVIGHEVSHILLRHSASWMECGYLLKSMDYINDFFWLFSFPTILFYRLSPDTEIEADRLSVQYIFSLGYDPKEYEYFSLRSGLVGERRILAIKEEVKELKKMFPDKKLVKFRYIKRETH